jgi:dTMP kinase
MKLNKGFFLTFEGGEGSGKSTQAKILYNTLLENNFDVILTREPGGSPLAELIRDILVKSNNINIEPVSEMFLFAAARFDHLHKIINPALKKNKIVICDRYIDSTIAYQGYAGNVSLEIIEKINSICIGSSYPNLTLIFDIDPIVGLKRSFRENNNETRFEERNNNFHNKIRDAFLEIANHNSRCSIIDASRDINVISKEIYKIFIDKLNIANH